MNPAIPARSEPRVELLPDEGPTRPASIVYWFNVLLAHRRGLLLSTIGGALIAFGLKAIQPAQYTAEALAVMDSQKGSSNLSGLTAQLGLIPLQADGSPSPYFYADLMTSDAVLSATVDSTFDHVSSGKSARVTLVSILGVAGSSPGVRRERAVARLRKMVAARVTPKTGVITVSAAATDPRLAAQIVDRLITEVNRINVQSRQNQAGGEREFTGRRVIEAAQELRAAENALQDFLDRNRDYRSAPRTAFEEDRLARAVAMRQTIYTSVSQAYEQARIEEARDTPGLRVIAPPLVPASPRPRGLPQAILLGALLGMVLGACGGLWKEYLQDTSERDPEQAVLFRERLHEAMKDLSRPWRLVRRSNET